MRLGQKQVRAIKSTFSDVFGNGEIYLFGSRVDDKRRGGDIDLYIVPDDHGHLAEKRSPSSAR